MPTKRTIRRITPGRVDAFDDHFWPVVVALCVLSAIGFGAILTLLSGPVMWLSLLVLPAMTAGAMFFLSQMNDTFLRRTLQFSLILSLAGHLLILIIASLLLIFSNGKQNNNWQKVAKRKVRTIEFSNQNSSVSIPVTKPDNTPEPDVEIQRNQESQVTSAEQPIPVPDSQPTVSPQTRRRETTQQTVPRFDESLSKLRRNRMSQQMKSSVAVKSPNPAQKEVTVAKPSPAAKPDQPTKNKSATAASEADSISRSSSIRADRQVVRDAKPKQSNQKQPTVNRNVKSNSQPTQTAANSRLTKVERRETNSESQQRKAHARISNNQVEIRKQANQNKPKPVSKSSVSKNTSEPKPAEASGQLTRRPRRSKVASSSDSPSPLTRRKTTKPSKTKVTRRENPTRPTVTNRLSTTKTTRLATNDAPTIRSVEPTNRPSPNPKSSSTAESLEARTLSITKGQAGTAGAVAQQNLQSGQGGLPSPAVRASDSMLNRREQSPSSQNRMLANSQASEVRRSMAESARPTSAFKADTVNVAKISGSKSPTLETVESSAAEITSASSESRNKVAIDKGEAPVNVGSTKVVAEARRRRLSGGGSPEVASLSPSLTRRSSADSETRPSLASSEVAPTAAPRESAAEPTSADGDEPTELAEIDRRSEGPDSQAFDHDAAPDVDPTANEGSAAAPQLAANRREVETEDMSSRLEQMLKDLANASGDADDDDEEERLRRLLGNSNVRVAKAPNVDRESEPEAGSESAMAANGSNSATEAEVVSRSRGGNALSAADLLGQSMTRLAVQAAASLPVVEGALSRRSEPREAEESKRNLARTSRSSDRELTESAPNVSAEVAMANSTRSGKGTSTATEDSDDDGAEVEVVKRESANSSAGFALDVEAFEGPVGLSRSPDVSAGVNMRPASETSRQIQPELETRFRNEDFGGAPAMNPTAKVAKEAFRQRAPGMAQRAGEPKTEAAIHQGLEFLARYQLPDGSWSLNRFDTEHPLHKRQLDSDMAATGLAVLAFQGAGYNHLEFKYARQVNHAIRWLVKNQGEDGLLYLESDEASNNACRLYSHGIAALALTEAYGMTQDPTLKEPAQKALNYIAYSQHPRKGGWRYFAEMRKRSSDTSVSGWMVMALQSGRLSGLEVEDSTFESIASWLKVAADPANESLYRYNPYAVNSSGVSRIQGRNASPSMTAVGLLMRIYTGWERDDPRLVAGANYLISEQMPGETLKLRDTYYWYYATQVLKHVDGPLWEAWNSTLRPLLIRTQEKSGDYAGSWDPYGPVPDRWAPFGGRLYVTTMNLLSLEVRHRLLPLYQKTNLSSDKDSEIIIIEGGPFE